MSKSRHALAVLLTFSALSQQSFAQSLRGTITDAANQRPLPGALVQVLDSDGKIVDRELTSIAGEFYLSASSRMHRLRIQRLGFKPKEIKIPPERMEGSRIDVALTALPTMLDPVPVRATACSPSADRVSAMSFYEHARAGLLAMVAARESKRGSLVAIRFEQVMAGSDNHVVEHEVSVDSTQRAAVSFTAALSAADFVRTGFVRDGPTGRTFLAPDPDVLLHDEFVAGYCFHVAPATKDRPNQIGLGFVPSDRKSDRVDVEGVLWVDTIKRSLRDIEFSYVGLGRDVERLKPGGLISLEEMANGLVLITRWHLRLIGEVQDTTTDTGWAANRDVVRSRYYANVTGGELARARWDDGTQWQAPLGRFRGQALMRDGRPAQHVMVRLARTPYRQRSDSAGRFEFLDLVPGPYDLVVEDSILREIDIMIPTKTTFLAMRDSVVDASVTIPTAAEYVRERCQSDGAKSGGRSALLLARVMDSQKQPVAGVEWSLKKKIGARLSDLVTIHGGGKTGDDGMLQVCSDKLRQDDVVMIDIRPQRGLPIRTMRTLKQTVTIVGITLD